MARLRCLRELMQSGFESTVKCIRQREVLPNGQFHSRFSRLKSALWHSLSVPDLESSLPPFVYFRDVNFRLVELPNKLITGTDKCCSKGEGRDGGSAVSICLGVRLVSLLPAPLQHSPLAPAESTSQELSWRALRCTCGQTPPLLLSRHSTSAEPKTPVNRGDKFPAGFGSRGEGTPGSRQYKV